MPEGPGIRVAVIGYPDKLPKDKLPQDKLPQRSIASGIIHMWGETTSEVNCKLHHQLSLHV